MKNIFLKILLAILVLAILFCVPSETVFAEIIEIPIDETKMPAIQERYYLSDTEYEDPSLSISITYDRAYDTDYVVARIKTANASQLRSYQASRDGRSEDSAILLAKKGGGVLSMNGDFYRTFNPGLGKMIIRQGRVILSNPVGVLDSLIIDENGDFHIIQNATKEDFDAFQGTIVNCYSFGPGLVIDGKAVTEFTDHGYGLNKRAQRSCICQIGKLEYMIIICAGPDNPGSTGLLLDEWAALVSSFDEVQQAYNLDGGSSAALIFRGEKINTFNLSRPRELADILLFATAWQEEEP